MSRPPQRPTLTATLFPCTALFRSQSRDVALLRGHPRAGAPPYRVVEEPARGRPPLRGLLRPGPASWRRPTAAPRKRAASTSASTSRCRWSRSTRSEEHTSELQSLKRISYAVYCLKKQHQPKT